MIFLIYTGCIAAFMILAKIVQSVILRRYGKTPREIFIFLTYLLFGVCGQFFGITAIIQSEVPKLINRSAYEAKLMIRSTNPGFVFIEEGIDIELLLEYEDTAEQILDICVNITASPETMAAQLKQIYRDTIADDNAIPTWVIDWSIDLFREQIYAEIISSLNSSFDSISPNIDIREVIIAANDAYYTIKPILDLSVDANGKISLFSIIDWSAGTFTTGIYLGIRRQQNLLLLIAAIYTGVLLAGAVFTSFTKKRHGPTVA